MKPIIILLNKEGSIAATPSISVFKRYQGYGLDNWTTAAKQRAYFSFFHECFQIFSIDLTIFASETPRHVVSPLHLLDLSLQQSLEEIRLILW